MRGWVFGTIFELGSCRAPRERFNPPYVGRPECSPPTTGLTIASTAAADSTRRVRHEPVQPALRNRRLERINAIDDTRVHRVFDHNARALAQCVRGGGDRDGAFRAAVGSVDSREPKEREAGPLWAADAFVRLHAEVESTSSGRHIARGECGPAHLAVHARDLGLITDRRKRLERLAVQDERAGVIALGERHLGQETERQAAAFAIVQTFLDSTRLFNQDDAGVEVAAHEAQHPFDRH